MSRAVSMVVLLVCVATGGCSFDPNGVGLASADTDAQPPLDAASPDAGAPDAAPAPPFCDQRATDLVACYRFEDPSNPLHDESAYGNDGAASAVTSVAGPPGHGSAIGFASASTTHIADDVSLDATTALTLELWVRPHSLPAATLRFGLLDNNGQYGLFLAPDGSVRCSMSSTSTIGLLLVVDQWSHVACSYDGAMVRLYQDGQVLATTQTSITLGTGAADGMAIGMNSPSGDVLDGAVDDVRIWRVARSDRQICQAAGRADCKP